MNTAVTKNTVEAYRVAVGCEHATIVVQGWQKPSRGAAPQQMLEQGEILIHSSHGSWGHYWGNMGRPVKQFLAGASFDYLMGKLLPGSLREFDFEASLLSWKKHLVAARRSRQLDAETFREVWDESCRTESCGIEMFMHRLSESQPFHLQDHPLWDSLNGYAVCRYSPQAKAFWDKLWSEFVAALRQESTAANEEQHKFA